MTDCVSAKHPHLATVRHTAQEILSTPAREAMYSPDPPLGKILAVGASYNARDGFDERDIVWLNSTLMAFERLDIAPPKDFKVMPVNMVNGEDILDPSYRVKADVLVSCFIINPRLATSWDLPQLCKEGGTGYNVSSRHTDTAWGEAAKRTDARLIITFNRGAEVCGDDFVSVPGFVKGPQAMIALPWTNEAGKPTLEPYLMETVLREDLADKISSHHPRSVFGRRGSAFG